MNRMLIAIGLLCAVAASIVHFSPRKSGGGESAKPQGVPVAAQPATTGTTPSNASCGHAHHGKPQSSDANPSLQVPLRGSLTDPLPKEAPTFTVACGDIPALLMRGGGTQSVPSLAIPAFPRHGAGQIFIRSSVAGIDQTANLSVEWRLGDDGAVSMTLEGKTIVARCQRGRWALVPEDAPAALLDLARLTTSLANGFSQPKNLAIKQSIDLFDQSWIVTRLENGPGLAVLEAADRADPAGPRDALILVLGATGELLRLERFQADPSTAADPGFMVRRIRVQSTPSEPNSPSHRS